MRLSPQERSVIAQAGAETLPAGSRVWLFGSRTDDSARGGDIDLLVETLAPLTPMEDVDLSTRFAARIQRHLGERRIDVVMTDTSGRDDREIVRQARRRALPLNANAAAA